MQFGINIKNELLKISALAEFLCNFSFFSYCTINSKYILQKMMVEDTIAIINYRPF